MRCSGWSVGKKNVVEMDGCLLGNPSYYKHIMIGLKGRYNIEGGTR